MALRIKSTIPIVLDPGEQAIIPVAFERRGLANVKTLTFEASLKPLKSNGELLILHVDSATVRVTNRSTERVVIKTSTTLGTANMEGQGTSEPNRIVLPRRSDMRATIAKPTPEVRVSRAIPIIAPPAQIPSKQNASPANIDSDKLNNMVSAEVVQQSPETRSGKDLSSSTSASPGEKELTTLDVYAPPYIPDTLRAINNLPAQRIVTPRPRNLDYPKYTASFAGSSMISKSSAALQLPEPLPQSDELFPDQLSIDNYALYWTSALNAEFASRKDVNDNLALFDVPMTYDRTRNVFGLTVPGLSEGNLHVEVGDTVVLRQLQAVQLWQAMYPASGLQKGPGMSFTGVEYVANIVRIFRRQEMLEVKAAGLIPASLRFNVQFVNQERREEALASTLSLSCTSLGMQGSWLRKMIFPDRSQCTFQTHLNDATFSFSPYDSNMNVEQLRAVESIKQHNFGELPFLIDGPPGTGKTKTLVEAILQLFDSQDQSILVCAPSEPAADTLASRLSAHMQPGQLLRLNDAYRTFEEVPEKLLMFCCINDERFSLPTFQDLMKCRVVVTTCKDAYMLVQARVTNADLAELEHNLMTGLHPLKPQPPIRLHWSALVLDEAAQATELEALIPLFVINPPSTIPYETDPLCIMAGDPKQLNPRTASKTIAIETSLLARLLDRDVYRLHPLARSNIRKFSTLTKDMLPMPRPPFAILIRNYRSHPAILALPSALFYNDTLIPEATNTKALMSIPDVWRGRGWPVIFCQNDGLDELSRDGGGWFNVSEAHKSLQYAQKLLRSGKVAERDIAIITPFQANVLLIRKLARSPPYNLWSVNIGPLEAFQGLETPLLILCTTRTRSRFLTQDLAAGYGIIRESKRFNVALTRAKQGLIVIGNAELLAAADENWYVFLCFCWRGGLWEEDGEGIEGKGKERWRPRSEEVPSHVSRLERALVYAEDKVGDGDGISARGENGHGDGTGTAIGKQFKGIRFSEMDDESGMYASALAAEAALRND